MSLLGQRFNHRHAAGVTRYQVDRAHRHSGMFECVAIRAVEGTHHFIGSIQVFSRQEVEAALIADAMSVLRRTRACYRCGAAPEQCDCPTDEDPWSAEGEAAQHPKERW